MADPTLALDHVAAPAAPADPPGPADPPPPTPEFVFREYAPRIYAVARRLVGNEADAEDVTQDVLVQVVRKLHTFRGDAQLPTWLHRVTVNAALALREKRANRQKREYATGDEAILDTAGDADPVTATGVRLPRPNVDAPPDQVLLDREQRAVIDTAIGRLPDGFRETYVLADVEGLPNAEIADMLHLSVPAVKSRLHRARLRMRELLAPHFEEVGVAS
jgi:RNA polymerase sigma-70 factor (ECF subfamily)